MAYNEMGLSRLYLGELEEAIQCFGKAGRIAPRDPSSWIWMSGLGRAQIAMLTLCSRCMYASRRTQRPLTRMHFWLRHALSPGVMRRRR